MERREVVLYVRRGYHVEVMAMTDGSPSRSTLKRLARGACREPVPFTFVDQRPIRALERSGALARLVRGEV